jgi:acetoin utilization protein AcuB
MLVKNWMSKKVVTVDVDESMQQAIYLLRENRINLLPVTEGGKLIGVVTDRDLKKASPSEATTLDMHELLYLVSRIKVREVMAKHLYTIPFDYTVEEAAAVLLEKRISGLPVVDSKKNLVGVITRSEIFKVLISITGLGKKGIQIALRLPDRFGEIEAAGEIIRLKGGRISSILSSDEEAPSGFRSAYFRIYDLEREKLSGLLEELEGRGKLLYMVDHRENRRAVYPSEAEPVCKGKPCAV